MAIVVSLGTYSGALLGYTLDGWGKAGEPSPPLVQQVFAYAPHTSCVKCSRSVESLLLTGSSDETVRIFNLSKRREVGLLSEHSASLTALDLIADPSTREAAYALTGAYDGSLCLWECSNWNRLMQLRGHSGPIFGIAVHPSGRTALTISGGSERALRLWDLMRGTCAVSQKFSEEPVSVKWNFTGDIFAVLFSRKVLLRHATHADLELTIPVDMSESCLLTTFTFLPHGHFVVGDSHGTLRGYHLSVTAGELGTSSETTSQCLTYRPIFQARVTQNFEEKKPAKLQRIKTACALPSFTATVPICNSEEKSLALRFVSVTSDGLLSFWTYTASTPLVPNAITEIRPVTSVNTGARVTTMDINVSCWEAGCDSSWSPPATVGALASKPTESVKPVKGKQGTLPTVQTCSASPSRATKVSHMKTKHAKVSPKDTVSRAKDKKVARPVSEVGRRKKALKSIRPSRARPALKRL